MTSPYEGIKWPVDSKWVMTHAWSDSISLGDLLGEVVEVLQAESLAEALAELTQVCLYVALILYTLLGLNLKLWGFKRCLEEDIHRYAVWSKIFALYGVASSFSVKDFGGGNNYRRPHKVQNVLANKGIDITLKQAEALIESLTKGC